MEDIFPEIRDEVNLKVTWLIEGQGLTTECPSRIHLSTEVKDRPGSLRMVCGEHIDSPTVVIYLDQNYRYKSEATEIPPDVGLTPTRDGTRNLYERHLCAITLSLPFSLSLWICFIR